MTKIFTGSEDVLRNQKEKKQYSNEHKTRNKFLQDLQKQLKQIFKKNSIIMTLPISYS